MATIESELEVARALQQALLALNHHDIPNLKFASRCTAAKHIGGDFYTIESFSENRLKSQERSMGVLEYNPHQQQRICFSIGDVAGHGVSSALVMSLTTGLINQVVKSEQDPSIVLHKLNESLCKFLVNTNVAFVTSTFAQYFPDTGQLYISTAGHPPILHLSNNQVHHLSSEGVFLGMFDDETYQTKSFKMNTNDRLLLYTDGLLESKNSNNDEYGLDRLESLFIETQSSPIDDVVDAIYQDVNNFSNNADINDDQTILLLEFTS